jgi:xylulose-5-phosphate/fructose-6-phosphate phosphoketolase
MIVMRTPKGWTGPREVDGHKVEAFWRAHQVPMTDVLQTPEHLQILEQWMRSYKPEELFDANGAPVPDIRAVAPTGTKRLGATPSANGGVLRRALRMPDFRKYGVEVTKPGQIEVENTRPLGVFLRDIMKANMDNFRVFGPDENTSNKLDAIYEVSKKFWIAEYLPEDADGGELSPESRVVEMLSEHTLEGLCGVAMRVLDDPIGERQDHRKLTEPSSADHLTRLSQTAETTGPSPSGMRAEHRRPPPAS